jgi:hypothetical protein
MVRQLKYHEQKLLKKVDFLNVRIIRTLVASITAMPCSGNRMPISERSK